MARIPFPLVVMSLLMILTKSESVTTIPFPLLWTLNHLIIVCEADLPLTIMAGLEELDFNTVFTFEVNVNLFVITRLILE